MKSAVAYIKIIRPANAGMAALAAALGFWLSGAAYSLPDLALIIVAAAAAVGFGNVINDLRDIDGDRINHPNRPLPAGDMSPGAASFYSIALAALSLASAVRVSPAHGFGALIPLALLAAYAFWCKGIALAGNILVSFLVAYAICFGGLGAPRASHLIVPAALAFLLNVSREIIKDLQDYEGDARTGIASTATLSRSLLGGILIGAAILYVALAALPWALGHFGLIYLVCALAILPAHVGWLIHFMRNAESASFGRIAAIIKIEMLAGLVALAADRLLAAS